MSGLEILRRPSRKRPSQSIIRGVGVQLRYVEEIVEYIRMRVTIEHSDRSAYHEVRHRKIYMTREIRPRRTIEFVHFLIECVAIDVEYATTFSNYLIPS